MGVFQNHLMAAAVAKAAESTDFYTYQIANSCRFDRASSAYLNRTIQSGGDLDKWTLSFWMKLTASAGFGSNQYHLYTSEDNSSGAYDAILFDVNASSQIYYQITNKYFVGNHSIRDTSAWYHVVIVFDSANGTAAHRKRVWFNNVEDTGSDVQTYPQNVDSQINDNTVHNIGARQDENAAYFFDGYLADFIFVDAQAYAPTYFGEEKNGVWIPKDYKTDTGEYGTTGYHLDFASSGDLGNDISGNNNDWTSNNLVATDQMKDTPTFNSSSNGGNFATLLPMARFGGADDNNPTMSEGNLKVTDFGGSSSNIQTVPANFGITSGKWYWEIYVNTKQDGLNIGLCNDFFNIDAELGYTSPASPTGADVTGYYGSSGDTNDAFGSNGFTDYGDAFNVDDTIVGVAFDADNGKSYFSKGGVWQNSGDPAAGSNPARGSGGAVTTAFSFSKPWFPCVASHSAATPTVTMNFGQDGSFAGALSGGAIGTETDDTGYGAFKYDPPTGFLALCSGNLTTPAADPASEEGPNKYFVPKLYTGNGTSISVSTGFQTDLVWVKYRDGTYNNTLGDSSRGTGKYLQSDTDAAETSNAQSFTAFGSDGFTYGTELSGNQNTYPMISWNWKANGGTTTTNDASATGIGTIDSAYQVDTTTGFSIVTYTGTGSGGSLAHGLGAVPKFMIAKARSASGTTWGVYAGAAGNGFLDLGTTAAYDSGTWAWNNTDPTSSVFTVNSGLSGSGTTYVAYLFIEKEGFSKFGSYEGNGNANGSFVYTGFRPAWIMTKSIDSTSDWNIFDDLREGYNVDNDTLEANSTAAEVTTDMIDILSNGFKFRIATDPNVAETYVYMAFAKNPFKYATAR